MHLRIVRNAEFAAYGEMIDEAFLNCSGLISIELGSDIQHIGMGALKNCSSLISVTIPPNVTFIGDYAFANCSSLKNASIIYGVA